MNLFQIKIVDNRVIASPIEHMPPDTVPVSDKLFSLKESYTQLSPHYAVRYDGHVAPLPAIVQDEVLGECQYGHLIKML